MTLLGAVVAVTVQRPRAFSTVLGVLMTPLLFLSGLMFPVSAMPGWMSWSALADPLTYAVDAMRQTIASRTHSPSPLLRPPAWGGWHPPPLAELAVVAVFIAVCLAVAVRRFSRIG